MTRKYHRFTIDGTTEDSVFHATGTKSPYAVFDAKAQDWRGHDFQIYAAALLYCLWLRTTEPA